MTILGNRRQLEPLGGPSRWNRGEALFSRLQSNKKRGPVGAGNDVTAGLNFGIPLMKSVREKDEFSFKETPKISEIASNQRFTSAKLLYSGPKKQSGFAWDSRALEPGRWRYCTYKLLVDSHKEQTKKKTRWRPPRKLFWRSPCLNINNFWTNMRSYCN